MGRRNLYWTPFAVGYHIYIPCIAPLYMCYVYGWHRCGFQVNLKFMFNKIRPFNTAVSAWASSLNSGHNQIMPKENLFFCTQKKTVPFCNKKRFSNEEVDSTFSVTWIRYIQYIYIDRFGSGYFYQVNLIKCWMYMMTVFRLRHAQHTCIVCQLLHCIRPLFLGTILANSI